MLTLFFLKITVKADLPVGANFHDHLAVPLGPFFKTSEQYPESDKLEALRRNFQDAWNSSTILRMPLINLKYNLYSKEMAHFLGMNETTLHRYMNDSQAPSQIIKKSLKLHSGDETMFINVAIKKPVSRGEVRITANDPKLPPVINPNFLNAIYHHDAFAYSSEKQQLIEALEETVRLMEANPNVKSKFTEASFPGCESLIFRGYGYWDCYIRHFSMSFNHGVGTCAMGTSTSAPSSVVDAELKVLGVEGLRVIDASVMPILVGTYPFQSVAVIAEKGADMIIKQHKLARKIEIANQLLENIEEDHSRHDQSHYQPFIGFRIKKLSAPAPTSKPIPFAMSKSWQNADQISISKSYSHQAESSLSEDDLIPPGEPPTPRPNPSYFSVKPLAGRLIFYPLVPQQNIFQFHKEASRADVDI